jgi:hypothetical protein
MSFEAVQLMGGLQDKDKQRAYQKIYIRKHYLAKKQLRESDSNQYPECEEPVAAYSQTDRVWSVFTASGWVS